MRYLFLDKRSVLKAVYEGVAFLRTDHGLVKVMRKANEQEPAYQTLDPYVIVAVIHLGYGERLVSD